MINHLKAAGLVAVLGCALTACTSGNSAIEPAITSANPVAQNKLQFAVGTATIGNAGAAGLNTVVTFRQPNGLSGTLVNTPTITGPAGFVVPTIGTSCSPSTGASTVSAGEGSGTDAGTNRISGTPQTPPGTVPVCTTFGTNGGAFGYGFAADNASTSGAANFNYYFLPFYQTLGARYVGGPPTFPNVRDGTFPLNFPGYSEGFTDFKVTPVVGTYTLSVLVPSANPAQSGTLTASAALNSATLALPPFGAGAPVFTPNGTGGGTVAVTFPAGITEGYVEIVNVTGYCFAPSFSPAQGAPAVYYTLFTRTPGAQVLTLPDNIGPAPAGTAKPHSLCTSADNGGATGPGGDNYRVYAVGFDYPAFEAAYPANTSQTPTITGANGQADITQSSRGALLTYP